MLNDKVQKQSAGDSSTNLQAAAITINNGLTYRDAKEIALDVYKENFFKLRTEAAELATKRAEELTDNFLSALKKKNESAIQELAKPGMQIALYSAQKEYAKTGDADLQQLLVDILVERAQADKRDLKQIVLDESLSVAPKLTVEQIDALTFNWLVTRTRIHTINRLETLGAELEKFFIPFIENLTDSSSCYEHLQYLGCCTLVQFGGWGSLEERILGNYTGLFCKGLPLDVFHSELGAQSSAMELIRTCLHNKDLYQPNALDEDVLSQLAQKKGLDEATTSKLKAIFQRCRMETPEVKRYVLNLCPKLEKTFKIWADTSISKMTLTTVGYAIAQANLRRRTGTESDLSIWVK